MKNTRQSRHIIKPCTRTLYFDSYSKEFFIKYIRENVLSISELEFSKIKYRVIDNSLVYQQCYIFKLNLPAMEVYEYEYDDVKKWYVFAIDENDNTCFMPLPNIYDTGQVCCEKTCNIKSFLNVFYNHAFNFSLTSSMNYYLFNNILFPSSEIHKNLLMLTFLQNWQDSGKIKLIPYEDNSD